MTATRAGTQAALLAAALACGCSQRTAQDDEYKRALERRVAELEAKLEAATSSPTPTALPPPTAPSIGPARSSRPRASSATLPRPAARPSYPAATLPDDDMTQAPWERVPPPHEPAALNEKPPVGHERWSIPDGAELLLVLRTPLSSRTSVIGDPVLAGVEQVSDADGPLPLPGASVVEGRVTRARPAGRVGSRAMVSVVFEHITVRGRQQSLEPIAVTLEGGSDLGRDGALVGSGAATGAVVGRILGGRKGERTGAVIGAIVGGGAATATRSEDLSLVPGDRLSVIVDRTANVP